MALQRDEEVEFLQDQRVVAGLAELAVHFVLLLEAQGLTNITGRGQMRRGKTAMWSMVKGAMWFEYVADWTIAMSASWSHMASLLFSFLCLFDLTKIHQ